MQDASKVAARAAFDRLVAEFGLVKATEGILAAIPMRRGRSMIDDHERLAEMARLLADDKTLTPTAAARKVLGHGSNSQVRRLVRKFKFRLDKVGSGFDQGYFFC